MYLHIGKDVILKAEDIIGIFDIESLKKTGEYKRIYEDLKQKGKIIPLTEEEKTLILIKGKEELKAYISNISSNTIAKRTEIE